MAYVKKLKFSLKKSNGLESRNCERQNGFEPWKFESLLQIVILRILIKVNDLMGRLIRARIGNQ